MRWHITQEFEKTFKAALVRVVDDIDLQVVLLAVCKPSAHLMYETLPAIDCRLPFAYMCGGEVRVFSWQPSFPYTWKDL